MFHEPFFGTKKCSEKGNKFDVWFFRELSPKTAKLPPLLLDNPILDKHKRKEYLVLLRQFMVDCCLRLPQRDRNENHRVDGKVIARLVSTVTFVF